MRGFDTGWRLAALALAWLAGVALHLQQRELQALPIYLWATGLGLAGLTLAWFVPRMFVAAVMGAALLAFGMSGWRAAERLAESLPIALEGQDLTLIGVVASLPQVGDSGLRFRFEVEQATLRGEPVQVPARVSLGWYRGWHEDAALSLPQTQLAAGQRWRFTVRLRRPHGNLNPHGFDFELAMFEQSLRATGYVRDAPAPQLLARSAGHPIERLRQHVRDAIDAHVGDPRAAGVLAALSVGDQGAIERDDWDLFRNTGVAHLVSISGLHITMFAWAVGLLTAALWRRSGRAMLWLPTPQAARWTGLLVATAYAVCSGWGVPSQRTVWMLATVTLLGALGLHWPWPLVLLAAAVVVSAVDPWALLQPGFWLSFAAVGLLMASEPALRTRDVTSTPPAAGWRGWPRHLAGSARQGLRTQVIATLGLAPLTLVFFQQLSLVGFLANLVAIPLITLAVTPLALLGSLLPALWTVAAALVQGLVALLAWLASWPAAVWMVPVAPLWAQAAGLLAAALLVAPLPFRLRLLALPLACPLLWPQPPRPAEGQFELVAVDVGQGTAVLLRTRGHLLVYDAGPRYGRDSDAGQRVLLPLLRARGETRIDRLVLSHRDSDHVGGAASLIGGLPVASTYNSLEIGHPLLALAPAPTRCSAGQSWLWDGVRFDVLRPQPADYDRVLKSNAMSCVLRVSAGGRSVLLTGDIERDQELALVAEHGQALRSDVLIVPHHGSRTSSTAELLDAVRPTVAVFQNGYRNRFGHPADEVLARYLQRAIEIRLSPTCGAWSWQSWQSWQSGAAVGGRCLREESRRYWQQPQAANAQSARQ